MRMPVKRTSLRTARPYATDIIHCFEIVIKRIEHWYNTVDDVIHTLTRCRSVILGTSMKLAERTTSMAVAVK